MSKPREWPNNARHARDRAAEEALLAYRILKDISKRMKLNLYTKQGVMLDVLEAQDHIQAVLRHLESVGAPTLPE